MEMIGRYRISHRIGAGSFATVYKAHDDQLDVTVAIKVLADNWCSNQDVRSRFLAEARLMRRISDEHIVRVHDIGTTSDGRPYFVMDHADGGSLEDLRRQPVAPGRALRLCAEAARGLEVLHREHLVHRDVTPGNILLAHSPNGLRVMLADLGVAKSMVDDMTGTMTAGTPSYMAWEQASGTGIDQRSDVYSMAAVTYALLTGNPPFPARSLAELLARDPQLGPDPVSQLVGAPAELDMLFTRALSATPGLRPQRAIDLATALDEVADQMPGGEALLPRPSAARLGGPRHALDTAEGDAPAHSARSTGGPRRAPLVHPKETPAALLEDYLGPGRYQPAPVRERHSAHWYVGLAATMVGLFLLAGVVALSLLG